MNGSTIPPESSSFTQLILKHREIIAFITAIVAATIAIISFFATKTEVTDMACRVFLITQRNTDSAVLNKTYIDIMAIKKKINDIKNSENPISYTNNILEDYRETKKALEQQKDKLESSISTIDKAIKSISLIQKCPKPG